MSRFFNVQLQPWKHWPKVLVVECYEHDDIDGDGGSRTECRYVPEVTCEPLVTDNVTSCIVRRNGFEREYGYWKCSNCGCECFEGAKYCMNCGARVVGEFHNHGFMSGHMSWSTVGEVAE